MNRNIYLLFISLLFGALAGNLVFAQQDVPRAGDPPLDAEKARKFIEEVNDAFHKRRPLLASASWIQSTYITEDAQRVAAYLNEQNLAWTSAVVKEAAKFNDVEVDEETARALTLLKVGQTLPGPDDPNERAELAEISSRLEATYGAGSYCPEGTAEGSEACLDLGELEAIIRTSRDPDSLLEAWTGWRTTSPPMREDYQRFVELGNAGADALGYDDLGVLWRSGYDMSPEEFSVELERLWNQIQSLYDELHCYVRGRLEDVYGTEIFADDNLIPAHLLGNMWSQEWGHIYPLVEPYSDADDTSAEPALSEAEVLSTNLDVTSAIEEKSWTAHDMVESAEDFYESLGLRALPESFWENSMFTKPRDRDVVCHASAWDMDMRGDVRIKICASSQTKRT